MSNLQYYFYDDECNETIVNIIVETCIIVPPFSRSPQCCPSDWDYYGYSDIEFSLQNLDGTPYAGIVTERQGEEIELLIKNDYTEDKNVEHY